MRPNILTDIAAGVRAVRQVREARKSGTVLKVSTVKQTPMLTTSRWMETIEGWNIFSPLENKELKAAVKAVYYALDEENQRALMKFPQGPGAWVERAQFWRELLRETLDPEMYHLAMEYILDWYVHRFTRRPTLHIAVAWGEPERHR